MKRRRECVMIVAVLIVLLTGCASKIAANLEIPDELAVPLNQVRMLETRAVGFQIYECRASKSDPSKFEWVFKAPQAELFKLSGSKIGKHYAGPTWEANDGSKVTGEVIAKKNSPDLNAIPWLLLRARSISGIGIFGQIKSIQRLNTVGGASPTGDCSSSNAGKEYLSPYEANYYFYVEKSN